jgi:hypothetical protein
VDRPPKIATVKPQTNGTTILLLIIELDRPLSHHLTVIVDQEKNQNREVQAAKYDGNRFTNIFPLFLF